MCGIAGLLNVDGAPVAPRALFRMAEVLRHRGPDGQGFVLLDSRGGPDRAVALAEAVPPPGGLPPADLGFAHRRLAIIDLSPTGHQPMASDDGTVWVTYNGEIYNHVELRAELAARGRRFRGRSDTEVLLHAYQEWGPACVSRFNGMWAFALWDARRRLLLCSRDRFGVKPLYYAFDGRRFAFASEIKALLAGAAVEPRVNDHAVHGYLARGYGYVDLTDETFFDGIRKLPPATNLLIDGEALRLSRYWDLAPEGGAADRSPAAFHDLFEDAVRLRLRSDVRVGGALSGGLDSSAITSLASRLLGPENYAAFSVCYDDERYDEREFMLPVVHKTGVKHHTVFPRPADFPATIERVLWHQDEPFPDLNIYGQWYMYSEVRAQGVKVFLNGHGGDETLGGYAHHHLAFLVDLLRAGRLARFAREVAGYAQHERVGLATGLGRVGRRWASAVAPAGLRGLWRGLRGPGAPYLAPDFAARYPDGTPPAALWPSFLKREMAESIDRAPLPAWLHLEDRNSMAFSVESRTPFLDYRLVEFLFRVPGEAQFQAGLRKCLLREAMRGILPEEVRGRTDKKGFQSAAEQWFRVDLAPLVEEVLGSASFRQRGYLDLRKVAEGFERHRRSEINLRFAIWSWVCLELWFRTFIDGGARLTQEART